MFGIDSGIRLPNELLLFVAKSLDDTDSLALALSRAFEGFIFLHDAQRKQKNVITVSYKYHFLSNPTIMNRFLNQHSWFPALITVCNMSNCYWLPADLLCDAIVRLRHIQELDVKGTKVSFSHLVRVFGTCQKITKLGFSVLEKKWEEIQTAVGDKVNMDIITGIFEKLTCLRVSTVFLDARDYLNDPWLVIIQILGLCQDCVELTIEITYMGDDHTRENIVLNPDEEELQLIVKKDLFLRLNWTTNLKKLVLIKCGMFSNMLTSHFGVQSLLLDDLFSFIFYGTCPPSSLHCLWIHEFHLNYSPEFFSFLLEVAGQLKSFFVSGVLLGFLNYDDERDDDEFYNVEHLGGIKTFVIPNQQDERSRSSLQPKLNYARILDCAEDEKQGLDNFIWDHPHLEHLSIVDSHFDYTPSEGLKLLKLTTLFVDWEFISKDRMEALVNFCPNLEVLRLFHIPYEDIAKDISYGESLSSIRFRNLISLSLTGKYGPQDGTFLLTVGKECPNLRSLHLENLIQPESFLTNFDRFLSLAVNLRDLRLLYDFNGNGSHILPLLESILKSSPHLERLVLQDLTTESVDSPLPNWNHPPDMSDFFVPFLTKMKRLVCCSISFKKIDRTLCEEVYRLVVEKVVKNRPSLLFHFDCSLPDVNNPDIPLIHLQEILLSHLDYCLPPPKF